MKHEKDKYNDLSTQSQREFIATMIENHRRAFTLFKDIMEEIERVISAQRDVQPAYNRALDLLFIQTYKSFSSVYVLWVRGHGEDAVTILRRLLEIAFQVAWLEKAEKDEKEDRGAEYLAYFWSIAEDLPTDFPEDKRIYFKQMLQKHERFLKRDKNGKILDWWGGGGINALARKVGLEDTYDKDYRRLCKTAHCTAQGILPCINNDVINIRSNQYDRFMEGILVFACRYMISIANSWNITFELLNNERLSELCKISLEFFGDGE
jgi:hypothetical protein